MIGSAIAPLFVGPIGFLVTTLLVIVLVLAALRLLVGLAWRLIVIVAIVFGILWLLGAVSRGPPLLT